MTRSVIVSSARTPFGRLGGGLAKFPPPSSAAIAIRAGARARRRQPGEVGHVVMGQVLQAGQGQIPSRQAQIGRHPEGGSLGDDQQGLRLGHARGRARRPGSAPVTRGRRRRRHGVDVQRAVPAAEGARFGYRQGDGKMVDEMIHDGLTNPSPASRWSTRRAGRAELGSRASRRTAGRPARTSSRSRPRTRATGRGDRRGRATLESDEAIRRDTTVEKLPR